MATLDVVELTVNEVAHAHNHQPTDLVVIDDIVLHGDETETLSATGGRLRIWRDWVPAATDLSPTRYAYGLPAAAHRGEEPPA